MHVCGGVCMNVDVFVGVCVCLRVLERQRPKEGAMVS